MLKRWHPGVLPHQVVHQGGMPGCWWLGEHPMPSMDEPCLWLSPLSTSPGQPMSFLQREGTSGNADDSASSLH